MPIGPLQDRLDELARKHKVPGATIAVLDGDELSEAATGVINLSTGVETTSDTVFQIGSITKVYTATMVMQFLDQGVIELDVPVRTYLSNLRLADSEAAESITVRQLLSHTSGIDGDLFDDTGRGDDCIEKYVANCARLSLTSAPGKLFSYCNAGYVILGHLIEKVAGRRWDAGLKDFLLEPLACSRSGTLPEEAILQRAAVGHIDPTNSGEVSPAPVWMWPRAIGPAGLINSTAAEVITFARMHLDRGVSKDGNRVLSVESVRAMQEPQVELPDPYTLGKAWGLGWILQEWGSERIIGHDGSTIGQNAFLRVASDHQFAVALLTNAPTGHSLYRELYSELFSDRVGVQVPDLPRISDDVSLDLPRYIGRYERRNVQTTVEEDDSGLLITVNVSGPTKDLTPPIVRIPLRPVDHSMFLMRAPVVDIDVPVTFFDFDDGDRPRYIHMGWRANPRVE